MFSSIRSISLKDKILFYESVANLLDGWVTLLSALRGFSWRLQPWAFKEWIDNTIFFIEWGDLMNVAMRKIPNFYREKEIAIIESGEQTGMLRTTFEAIAQEMRTQEELRRKVIGALTYPFIIMIFLGLALIVVMTYVIPQIMPIILEMTTEIPFSTRSLVAVSSFLSHNILLLILGTTGLGLMLYGYANTDHGRRYFDREKIIFPIIGWIYRNFIVVQVMSTFHLLSSSGVSVVRALRLTWASSGNRIIEDLFWNIADNVSKWQKISESMRAMDKESIIFKPDILQMIESAEQTSTVHSVTEKIAEQYRREVDASLSVMVKFVEPIALLMAWVFVLWFAIAIFSAIMEVVALGWAV